MSFVPEYHLNELELDVYKMYSAQIQREIRDRKREAKRREVKRKIR